MYLCLIDLIINVKRYGQVASKIWSRLKKEIEATNKNTDTFKLDA